MRTLVGLVLAALTVTAVAGSVSDQAKAQAPAGKGRVCFPTIDVEGWQEQGPTLVLFKLKGGDTWRGELEQRCADLDRATGIRLDPVRAGQNLCSGDDGVLQALTTANNVNTCEVFRFAKLTPEEAARVKGKFKNGT